MDQTRMNFCPLLTTSPVLETEAVTCNLPHGVGRSRLGSQQEVLVEVVLFVSIKLHSSTGHNKNCGLGLSSLLFTHIK